jgi:putative ABC transport system substrate-binding protein
MLMIGRREFITMLGASAAAWPLAAGAQQGERMRLIVVSLPFEESEREAQARLAQMRPVLRERGWIEGRNLRIAFRSNAGALEQIPAIAAGVVALNPDVVVASNTPFVRELQRQAPTIPVVFAGIGDPIESGVVASFARPGGNATGFLMYETVLGGKWLELLKEAAPAVNRVLILTNAGNSIGASLARMAEAAAPALRCAATTVDVRHASEIEPAITDFAASPNAGMIVVPASPIVEERSLVIALANRLRVPAVYGTRFFVADGGLMSFGVEARTLYGPAAGYVDRILRGEKPADMPVQAPVKFELVVNLKAAKTIGFTIPPTFLVRADEIIE